MFIILCVSHDMVAVCGPWFNSVLPSVVFISVMFHGQSLHDPIGQVVASKGRTLFCLPDLLPAIFGASACLRWGIQMSLCSD